MCSETRDAGCESDEAMAGARPVGVSGAGLQLILQAEVKDDQRVIEVLSQPAASTAQAASAT